MLDRNYKAIAAIVKHTATSVCKFENLFHKPLANELADYFAAHNPLFNRERFLTACGIGARVKDTAYAKAKTKVAAYAEQKALRQTTAICSCCTTEIKDGDAILFAGNLKLCSVCVARIGKSDGLLAACKHTVYSLPCLCGDADGLCCVCAAADAIKAYLAD